ncbi:hypothetical protein GCM10017607_22750 [Microbacterium thalassium]|nr:hypothetical protein GCM10017607_22750 [Microbacterium thalassium]
MQKGAGVMTTHTGLAPAAPRLVRARGVRLVSAGRDLWRVTDGAGIVIGHLSRAASDGASDHERPYRARRFRPSSAGFVDVGTFWSADDAVDALRFSR